MPTPVSRHRLRSNAFIRPDEENEKVPIKRVIFLSVEGDNTETDYFTHLNKHLDNSIMKNEVLRHKQGDGYSDPQQVIDLLAEYMNIREGELIPNDVLNALIAKYSKSTLQAYINDCTTLTSEQRNGIKADLLLAGIDLDYRQYLQHYKNNPNDIFAVILDRDAGSSNHARELMEECVRRCEANSYRCYISNPCFEFWLLLHLCDVRKEYTTDRLEELRQNQRISNRHTVISNAVSRIARHSKSISSAKFEQFYFPNIAIALSRAKDFANSFPDIYDQLGTNLPQLLNDLGFTSVSVDN